MTTPSIEKMQNWRRLGRIFNPEKHCRAGFRYGANPIFWKLDENWCRLFFTSRDESGNSHIFLARFDLDDPTTTVQIESESVLSPGRTGHFDDAGVMANSTFVDTHNNEWLLYVGWNRATSVPFRNALGLARILRDGNLVRFSQGPILDRSIHDPCFVASACAFSMPNSYSLCYTSGEDWIKEDNGELQHRYRLKLAHSTDFVNWQREGEVAVDYLNREEICITSPCILKQNGVFKMWFSCRSKFYRIGYAESSDGISWQRADRLVNFLPGTEEWENEAVCYPSLFEFRDKTYMLYNGNNFGKGGFGLAVLDAT